MPKQVVDAELLDQVCYPSMNMHVPITDKPIGELLERGDHEARTGRRALIRHLPLRQVVVPSPGAFKHLHVRSALEKHIASIEDRRRTSNKKIREFDKALTAFEQRATYAEAKLETSKENQNPEVIQAI
jgi:hypothetical protein